MGCSSYRSDLGGITSGEPIHWTEHASWSPIENMGIDHGGFDVLVAEQLLNGADIVAVLEQVGCKGVPEGVACSSF